MNKIVSDGEPVDPIEKIDQEIGTYQDKNANQPVEQKVMTAALPMGPNPSPFTLK